MLKPLAAFAALTLAACAHDTPQDNTDLSQVEMPGPDEGVYPSMLRMTADMIGADGKPIGNANILSGPNGALLRVELKPGSLAPGWHGLHLHQKGDCSDVGTFKASGGHHGKGDGTHGLLNPKGPEAGDIPNIWAAADGSAGYEAFSQIADVAGLADADGAALIIHSGPDDHMTQPIGGAGARVACGVIK